MGRAHEILADVQEKLAGGGEQDFSASYSFAYTEEIHGRFEEVSGSHNPVHTDEEFAKSREFRGRVGYGFVTCAMLSAMVGEHIPRKLGLYGMCRGVSADFRKPVYVGDVLTYNGKLTAVHKSVCAVTIDVTVTNRSGDVVATARMNAGVFV
jgi:acyl dehydratase